MCCCRNIAKHFNSEENIDDITFVQHEIVNIDVSEEVVLDKLTGSLNCSKCPGPDGLHPRFFVCLFFFVKQ